MIGAGIIGVCTALYLQRDGHRVTLIDREGPGEGASKGNASVIAGESCVPVATPGILKRVPGMLLDPMGPLALRWGYLPKLAPWLWQFVRATSPERVEAISIALRALSAQALESYWPLIQSAGVQDMIRRTGWLIVYETDEKFGGAQAGPGNPAPPRRRSTVSCRRRRSASSSRAWRRSSSTASIFPRTPM